MQVIGLIGAQAVQIQLPGRKTPHECEIEISIPGSSWDKKIPVQRKKPDLPTPKLAFLIASFTSRQRDWSFTSAML